MQTWLASWFDGWIGETPAAIALAVAAGFGVTFLVLGARGVAAGIARRLARHATPGLDEHLATLVRKTSWVFAAGVGLAVTSSMIELPPRVESWVAVIVTLAVLWQLGRWGVGIAVWVVERLGSQVRIPPPSQSPETDRAPAVLRLLAQMLVWTVVALLALDNVGIDVTALIAGLGVGGIAIALAVQNVLGDLFASLSIVLDRPFEVGDFVVVGTERGTVERIGLKTTRVRALDGHQLVFSNSDLLASRVNNLQRMAERRALVRFRLGWETPADRVLRPVEIVREIVEATDGARLDRVHLDTIGDFGFEYEAVWWVDAPDYPRHMDVKQRILVELIRRLEAEGFVFALPVQKNVGDPIFVGAAS